MHANSIAAYSAIIESGAKMTRACLIFKLMTQEPPLTDRQIASRLGFGDMNCVRPRVTELIKQGVFVECGRVKDSVTGLQVRVVKIKDEE